MTGSRKFIAGLLLAALLLMLIPTAYAQSAFTDSGRIKNTQAVTMLTELGVISGFEDGTFRPEDYVTRAQAAKLISTVLMRKDSYSWDGSSTFSDSNNWAAEYIEYCAHKGIISGYTDGTFDPEGYITAQQLAKMLLVAMGWDSERYIGSQWADNVKDDAWSNNLYDSFTGSIVDPLTRDDACLLIFNALKALAVSGYDQSGKIVYRLDDLMNPITMMEYYFDVKLYTEIVTGNEFADLTTKNGRLEQGMTKLAGHREFAISTGMEYLGRQVNIYLDSKGQIVGQPVFSEQDLVMTFNGADEFDSFYRLGKLGFDSDTQFYLNYNEATLSVIGELTENSVVTMIERNGDDKADVLMVTQYQPITFTELTDDGWSIDNKSFLSGLIPVDMLYDATPEAGETYMAAFIGGMVHLKEVKQ